MITLDITIIKLLLDLKRRYHGLLFMVSIALVDARKTSLTGVQNIQQKKIFVGRELSPKVWFYLIFIE